VNKIWKSTVYYLMLMRLYSLKDWLVLIITALGAGRTALSSSNLETLLVDIFRHVNEE